MLCPLCDNCLSDKKDDYFYICKHCYALVKDSSYYISPKAEQARYEEHHNNVHNQGYQNFALPLVNAIRSHQHHNDLGLDYGCGTGPVVSYLLKKHKYTIKLYDPFFQPDEDYLNSTYDYIFSCEVFEHFQHPKHEIEKLLQLLKPQSKLYIMTHLYHDTIPFKHWYYRNDATHVFIYTKATIRYIASKYLLKIAHLDDRLIILEKS